MPDTVHTEMNEGNQAGLAPVVVRRSGQRRRAGDDVVVLFPVQRRRRRDDAFAALRGTVLLWDD